ncbi:hypothetical protein DM860_017363 [Cuscuta australis]|uniref:Secreted protein n=1 Tax=Cuscuta australis TaxID=267555 RepID=A0A328DED9_9ASTE|nr:hypothetical protein DM860_017363 [Cuscuta australis]
MQYSFDLLLLFLVSIANSSVQGEGEREREGTGKLTERRGGGWVGTVSIIGEGKNNLKKRGNGSKDRCTQVYLASWTTGHTATSTNTPVLYSPIPKYTLHLSVLFAVVDERCSFFW